MYHNIRPNFDENPNQKNNIMSDKAKKNLAYALAIALAVFGIYMAFKSNANAKKAEKFRVEIIKKDSLTKIDEGRYRRVLGDTITSYKKLLKQIKGQNEELYNQLVEAEKKPILVGNIVQKNKDKVDTVYIDNRANITSYYPEQKDDGWAIKYQNILLPNGKSEVSWNFGYMPINVTISETEIDGVFDIDYTAPSFVDVESVEFISLPMKPALGDKRLHWLAGGGIGNHFINETPFVQGVVGVDINNNQFQIAIASLGTVSVMYVKRF